jgi:hypothetical protein
MDATVRRGMTLLVACMGAAAAHADGLQLNPDQVVWPRFQARLGVTTAPHEIGSQPRTLLEGAGLLGDYYFAGPGFGRGGITGGFRATSGLFTGARAAIATPVLPAREGSLFTLNTYARMAGDGQAESGGAVPYVGVGYTGLSLRGGWGFSADIGLVGSGVRFGRSSAGSQVDDLLRELRLTPVLQLGVSYSF